MNQNESQNNVKDQQAGQDTDLADLEELIPDEIKGGTTRVDGVSKDVWTSGLGTVDVHY
jgi:hypothetical protein